MRSLERRYRLLLKVLPQWYRRDREEEMVGLFLAGCRERCWPGWGEIGAMLALAVRTRFAVGGAPENAVRLGGVVRWLGVLGLLMSFSSVAPGVHRQFMLLSRPEVVPSFWPVVSLLLPVLALVLLVSGRWGWAKVLAGALLVVSLVQFLAVNTGVATVVWHLPSVVAFGCLCLGFHGNASVPSVRRLVWWGGGAVVLGLPDLLVWGSGVVVLAVAVVGLRVYAFVRGEVALGIALSAFAALLVAGHVTVVQVTGSPGAYWVVAVASALLTVSSAVPVRRGSVRSSRLP